MKTNPFKLFSILFSIFIITGCAGLTVAPDLLEGTRGEPGYLIDSSSQVTVEINPKINNSGRIDESVKESINIALHNYRIFNSILDEAAEYSVNADITIASQSAFSFGNFKGKLEIRYQVLSVENEIIFDESIFTIAGSDKWYFSGAQRHSRSRAVNIAKNVTEFIEKFQASVRG